MPSCLYQEAHPTSLVGRLANSKYELRIIVQRLPMQDQNFYPVRPVYLKQQLRKRGRHPIAYQRHIEIHVLNVLDCVQRTCERQSVDAVVLEKARYELRHNLIGMDHQHFCKGVLHGLAHHSASRSVFSRLSA